LINELKFLSSGYKAVSRAFGALRVVVPRRELEKDGVLGRLVAMK
jgi:hypothetical protein